MKFCLKILMVLFVLGTVACSAGGGSASPQANIPLPSNDDPITVSSPAATGYVTVTGNSSAVPNDAIVIIEVVSSTSHFDFDLAFPDLIPSAYAATSCSSSLPECPTLNDDDTCRGTANEDGSFTILVPATTSDSLIISYLDDENNCSEVEAYGAEISDNIIALSFDVVAATYDSTNGLLYLLSSTSAAGVVAYDVESGESQTLDISLSGAPEHIRLVQDAAGHPYAVIQTSEETTISSFVAGASVADITVDTKTFVDSSDVAIADLDFLSAFNFTYSYDDDTCLDSSVFSTDGYVRLFFQSEGMLYVLEMTDGFTNVDTESLSASHNLAPRGISMSFGALTDIGLITSNQVPGLEEVSVTSSHEAYVVSIGDEGSEAEYVVVRQDAGGDYCSSSISFSSGTTEILHLGTATEPDMSVSSVTDVGVVLSFLDINNQALSLVNLDGNDLACAVSGELLFGDAEADSENSCFEDYDSSLGLSFTTDDLDVSNVAGVFTFISEDPLASEIFLLGGDNGASDFIVSDGTTESSYETEVVSLIHPVAIEDDSDSNNRLLLIDAGLSGDNSSNLVIYELNSSEQ